MATPTISAILPLSIWYHLPTLFSSENHPLPESRRPKFEVFIVARLFAILHGLVPVLEDAGTSTTTGGLGGGTSTTTGAGAGAGAGSSPPFIMKYMTRPMITSN